MTETRQSLEKLGRFLLRGLRIGASTVSIVELLRNDWTGGDPQLGVAGCWIQLPAELPLRQQADHKLGGGAHQRAGAEVPADHGAVAPAPRR